MARPNAGAMARSLTGLRIDQGITRSMMSSMGLSITFSPTIGLSASRIDKLGMDIRSFREPLKRSIQQVIAPSFLTNFDVGGRPAWIPLSPSTLEIRSRFGRTGDRILVRTGALRRTMGQYNIWSVSDKAAMIKDLPANVWYGAIHQAGASSGGFKSLLERHGGDVKSALRAAEQPGAAKGFGIPARPFAILQEEDIEGIERVFWNWFEERVNRTWPVGGF